MAGLKIEYDLANNSLHSKIIKALQERIVLSETRVSSHYDRWRKAEKYYMLYKEVKKSGENNGGEDFESVVVPYSYANLLTAHTYMVNVFLNRTPVFQMEGSNGEGVQKELSLESLIHYQLRTGEMEPELFIWLLDVLRYGVGVIGNYWHEELIPLTEFVDEPEEIDGVLTGDLVQVRKNRLVKGYEGNKTFNVSPYDMLPDPRVPFIKLQEGEFFGRKFKMSWADYKRGLSSELYFNEEKAKGSFGMATDDSNRLSIMNDSQVGGDAKTPAGNTVGLADAIEITVELIPAEWDLGKSEYPEKWVFTLLDKKVIIGSQPLGYLHNKFPFHVLENEADGYKQASRGMLEVAGPMNDIMTWLFDSHMYNKRQVMNNQFVVDPSMVVMKDLQSRTPGKMVRLKPTAYGQDARKAITQLPVTDVTNQNYNDLQVVNSQMQQMLGINNDVAGMSAPSSRRSATEFRGTTSFAANRLANQAYYFSITGFRSLGQCLVSSTQQMYTVDMKVKVAGDNIKGAESITVSPEDIAGKFDISAIDGTIPLDRMAQAQFWMQALQTINMDPELSMQYRKADIFSYMARLAGLKGIDKFKYNIVSDEELIAMIKQRTLVEAGNGTGQTGGGDVAGATGIETSGTQAAPSSAGLPGLEAILGSG